MNRDTGFTIALIDGCKEWIRTAMARQERRMSADATQARHSELLGCQPPRPEPADQEIRLRSLQKARQIFGGGGGQSKVGVRTLEQVQQGHLGREHARQASTPGARHRRQHRKAQLVAVSCQEARGERKTEEGDAQASHGDERSFSDSPVSRKRAD